MVNEYSIRYVNKAKYGRAIALRNQGPSYSEIREKVPVAKSTLQNWLTLAGLTLTKEHIEIQRKKDPRTTMVGLDRVDRLRFRVYIHVNRKTDLEKILLFWSSKLLISQNSISVTWKKHIAKKRENPDYVGQMGVEVRRGLIIAKQFRAFSDKLLQL